MARIVVVDDDPDVRGLVADVLGLAGHDVEVVADGAGLRRLLGAGGADLYVLDVGLPGEDGFRLARHLREHHDPGIVMLTGADTVIDRVVGLEVGADDYVTKPFAPTELLARIDAVLRRRRIRLPEGQHGFGPYVFDARSFTVRRRDGGELGLLPMEVDLVAAFATQPGRVLDREALLRLAPPQGDDADDRSIDHRIARLRRKLETDPDHPQLIKTVRGKGYVFPG